MGAGGLATGIVFLVYLVAMLAPAVYAGRRLRSSPAFLAEYFLGGRNMSSWLLAMSFAATCISGGTFAGFPSKIYAHGWILFLWIGGYMVFPIFAMGLMGRRLNQLARRTGAITIPDVLRERFESSSLAVFGSLSIAIFLAVNLVAQFKAGGLILDVLLSDTPGYGRILEAFAAVPGVQRAVRDMGPGYVFSVLVFAIVVVLYTSYGGFRAVVWTDTLQGFVMLLGVFLLLPTVLYAAGGLSAATRATAQAPPSAILGTFDRNNALEYVGKSDDLDLFVEHRPHSTPAAPTAAEVVESSPRERNLVVWLRTEEVGGGVAVAATAREVQEAVAARADAAALFEARLKRPPGASVEPGAGVATISDGPEYLMKAQDRLFGPSRTRSGAPFHPLGMAISFFILWPFTGAGHPGFLVRLMAFRDARDLRSAMVVATIYFALTYIPLVVLFTTAQSLVDPASLTGGSDAIMPTVAKRFAHPLLAGLLLAAPFSAVMSTVSSFLLVISSSLVRDIYQRTIRREFSETGVRSISRWTTLALGAGVAWLALDPPEFLQDVVVFTSEGLAATFLVATFLGIYWPRTTTLGAWGAMTTGFAVMVASHIPPLLDKLGVIDGGRPIHFAGVDPFPVALAASFLAGTTLSLLSSGPPEGAARSWFRRTSRNS